METFWNYFKKCKDEKYLLISPAISFTAGAIQGYISGKSEMPIDIVDVSAMITIPAALGGIEYLVESKINQRKDIKKKTILAGAFVSIPAYNGGNLTGRYLSKLF